VTYMISYAEARAIAEAKTNSETALVEDVILEKSYGWYFQIQSKKYLESQDFLDMLVGSSGFVVEKYDGRVIQFGSTYSADVNLKYYEAGLKYKFYELTVLKINDKKQTFRALHQLKVINVQFSELRANHKLEDLESAFEKLEELSSEKLESLLTIIPYKFPRKNFYFQYPIMYEILNSNWFEYELEGFDEFE
jgi:hypothetical protein